MPDRVKGHCGQATLVPRPSELLRGLVAARFTKPSPPVRRVVGTPAAVQVVVWGYVSLAVCFTCGTFEPVPGEL